MRPRAPAPTRHCACVMRSLLRRDGAVACDIVAGDLQIRGALAPVSTMPPLLLDGSDSAPIHARQHDAGDTGALLLLDASESAPFHAKRYGADQVLRVVVGLRREWAGPCGSCSRRVVLARLTWRVSASSGSMTVARVTSGRGSSPRSRSRAALVCCCSCVPRTSRACRSSSPSPAVTTAPRRPGRSRRRRSPRSACVCA